LARPPLWRRPRRRWTRRTWNPAIPAASRCGSISTFPEGSRSTNVRPVFEPLDNAEFAWFSIDYRLAPEAHGMGGWRAPEMQHWKPEMIAWLQKTLPPR
jgi:hypothetical protein